MNRCAKCGGKSPSAPYHPEGLCSLCLAVRGDAVNHPAHYTGGGIETIDFIEAKQLNFSRGCVVKYIARAGKKDAASEVEDLRKAEFYIRREIERLEGQVNQGGEDG